MSKTDEIKEEFGWLKVGFALLVAMLASIVAWLAQNFETAKPAIVAAAALAAVVLGGFIVGINRRAFRRIRQLENL